MGVKRISLRLSRLLSAVTCNCKEKNNEFFEKVEQLCVCINTFVRVIICNVSVVYAVPYIVSDYLEGTTARDHIIILRFN